MEFVIGIFFAALILAMIAIFSLYAYLRKVEQQLYLVRSELNFIKSRQLTQNKTIRLDI